VETDAVNYLDAIAACVTLGGTLASIENDEEQAAVADLTKDTGAWIGLTDSLDEGDFTWVDDATFDYENWRDNQPNNGNDNQHCVWIRTDGEWDDILCKKDNAYVCQKKI